MKLNNRFPSTLNKLDNDPEFSRAETIIGFGDKIDTISPSV